jgi:hypothetical protein
MIDGTKEYTWLGVDDVQTLLRKVKHGFDTNKERLLINILREVVSFRAMMQLVVAMRLQGQHYSFRLRTSSNTPSVLTNVTNGSFHKFRGGNMLFIL